MGLFRDRKLVLWYEGRVRPVNWNGVPSEDYAWYLTREVELEPGHTYQNAAIYTDEYGRQRVYPGVGLAYDELEESWLPSTPYADGLTDWEF